MLKRILIVLILSILILSVGVVAQKTTTTTTRRGATTTFGTGFTIRTTTTIPQPSGSSQVFPPIPMTLGAHGGSIIIPPSSPGLTDIKGQPVIGFSTGGGITGYWGAGYHLWGPVGTATIEGEVKDVNTDDPIDGVSVSIDSRSTMTDATGFYRMKNVPADSYTVTASKTNYLTVQKPVTAVDNQISIVDFELMPFYTPLIDEGPVILEIVRDGDNVGDSISVTWSINTADFPALGPNDPVDIYMLLGDGTGQFTTAGWTLTPILNNNLQGFPDITLANKTFTYANQVGNNLQAEVYFKGVIAGSAPNDATYGLSGAAAVGKFNVTVAKPPAGEAYAYSFVSVPFVTVTDPNVVFGNQLAAAGSKANATELWGWTGATFGQQMYLEPGGWQTISGFLPVLAAPGLGYIIKTKSSAADDKIVSLVGKVLNTQYGPVNIAAGTYSFLGNPYPKELTLKAAGFTSAAGVHDGLSSGYSDQFWGWTGTTFGDQVYYNTPGDDWETVGSFALMGDLSPTRGLVYKRHPQAPAGGFNWSFGP